MNTILALALLFTAHVQAQRYDLPQRLHARGAAFGNETVVQFNSSTVSATSWSSPASSDSAPTKPSTRPAAPSSGIAKPTEIPPPDGDDGAACRGDVMTYFGSVYPTVYLTVTETYSVTLSAANATMTESETLITPPSACSSTVVPIDNPDQPLATLESTSSVPLPKVPPANSTDSTPRIGSGTRVMPTPLASTDPDFASNPAEPKPQNPDNFSASVVKSTIYASAPYTSTVIVTKKTPVPVAPQSEDPPPVFQPAPPSSTPKPPTEVTGDLPGADGRNSASSNRSPDTTIRSLVQSSNGARASGVGGIIASVINSPFAPATPTGPIVAQTTINNVPIAVQPSFVFIGSSAVAVPTGREEAVVTAGGATFTVRSDEIAAPSTTIGFGPLNPQGAISIAPTRVTAAPGVVVEVAGSTAVVDGTTFRINQGFSTVITVSGATISIGPSGIGLPSTTIAAGRVTKAPQIVETVGDVTFTIDGSVVIISGTSYGIATDSPTITTEIDGERISIGPGGIGFDSTTIRPTAAGTSTRDGSAGATGSTDSDGGGNAATSARMPVFGMLASLALLVVSL